MKRVAPAPITSQAASAWIPVDWSTANGTLSVAVEKSGTNTFNIEHTYDDVFNASVVPIAFIRTTGATSNAETAYTAPVTAVRVNVTAFANGSVQLVVLQGGIG